MSSFIFSLNLSLAVNWIYGVGVGENNFAAQSSSRNTEE